MKESVEYFLDQLNGIPNLKAKPMFGGYGIYSGDIFFAIEAFNRFFFKTDDGNRGEMEALGSTHFEYPMKNGKTTIMSYHSIPDEALENREMLFDLAEKAVMAAKRTKDARPPQKKKAK